HSVSAGYIEEISQTLDVPVENLSDLEQSALQGNAKEVAATPKAEAQSPGVSNVSENVGSASHQSLVKLQGKDYWTISITYGKFALLLPLIRSLLNEYVGLDLAGAMNIVGNFGTTH